VLGNHLGRVLNGIAGLLIRAGLLEDMGGKHITNIMRTMGQQPLMTPRCV
jgi:hypothetical protein